MPLRMREKGRHAHQGMENIPALDLRTREHESGRYSRIRLECNNSFACVLRACASAQE